MNDYSNMLLLYLLLSQCCRDVIDTTAGVNTIKMRPGQHKPTTEYQRKAHFKPLETIRGNIVDILCQDNNHNYSVAS